MLFERCYSQNRKRSTKEYFHFLSKIQLDHPVLSMKKRKFLNHLRFSRSGIADQEHVWLAAHASLSPFVDSLYSAAEGDGEGQFDRVHPVYLLVWRHI